MYSLPELPYAFDALEPYIDAKTMEIHHDKHHETYIENLNKAVADHPQWQNKPIEELIANLSSLPESIRTAVRNNGGGHLNHSLFWPMLAKKGGEQSKGIVGDEIKKQFGSFEQFQNNFNTAAKGVFGSGWAWLVLDKQGKMHVTSTPNQDSPISQGLQPILGLDVWEHAYYLKYQNKRVDYIAAWWHVVNWEQIQENYRLALK